MLREKATDALTRRAGLTPRQKIRDVLLVLNIDEKSKLRIVLDSHLR